MASPPVRVLVVDDDRSFLDVLTDLLRERGHHADALVEPGEALARVEAERYDVALLDLIIPGMGGLELGDRVKSLSPDTEVLILTGYADLQTAVAGIRHRVFDYIDKSHLDAASLDRSVRDAASRARLTRHNRELRERLEQGNRRLRTLLGVSARLAADPHQDRVLDSLARAALELVNASGSRVLLFQRGPGEGFVVEAVAGDGSGALAGMRLKPGEGLATLAVESDRAVSSARPAEDPRFSARSDGFGAVSPAAYLAVPLRHEGVLGAVVAWRLVGDAFTPEDEELLGSLAHQGAVALANAAAHERSVNFFTHLSDILVSCLDRLDVFYPGHSRRVAALADMVTRRLGLADGERRAIHFAALLHDIGKLLVDTDVLRTTGPVSDGVRQVMQRHPALAIDLLRPITAWEEILPLIHSHHERWDGKGYPRGLAGEDVPVGARIIAIADAFDAMTRSAHSRRRTPEEALAELEACLGTQFDPKLVRLFVAEYRARGDEIP